MKVEVITDRHCKFREFKFKAVPRIGETIILPNEFGSETHHYEVTGVFHTPYWLTTPIQPATIRITAVFQNHQRVSS